MIISEPVRIGPLKVLTLSVPHYLTALRLIAWVTHRDLQQRIPIPFTSLYLSYSTTLHFTRSRAKPFLPFHPRHRLTLCRQLRTIESCDRVTWHCGLEIHHLERCPGREKQTESANAGTMDANPSGSGQQQQRQQPVYDISHGGHYGMLRSTLRILLHPRGTASGLNRHEQCFSEIH